MRSDDFFADGSIGSINSAISLPRRNIASLCSDFVLVASLGVMLY